MYHKKVEYVTIYQNTNSIQKKKKKKSCIYILSPKWMKSMAFIFKNDLSSVDTDILE